MSADRSRQKDRSGLLSAARCAVGYWLARKWGRGAETHASDCHMILSRGVRQRIGPDSPTRGKLMRGADICPPGICPQETTVADIPLVGVTVRHQERYLEDAGYGFVDLSNECEMKFLA